MTAVSSADSKALLTVEVSAGSSAGSSVDSSVGSSVGSTAVVSAVQWAEVLEIYLAQQKAIPWVVQLVGTKAV
jgi:hypothetical protein